MAISATAIGQKIRERRNYKKISLTEFAKSLSMGKSSLSRIEKGETPVTAEELSRIAERLGVAPGWFYGDDAADHADEYELIGFYRGTRSDMRPAALAAVRGVHDSFREIAVNTEPSRLEELTLTLSTGNNLNEDAIPADRIQAVHQESGMSDRDFAAALGLEIGTVKDIEAGKITLPIEEAPRIAKALRCDETYLLYGRPDKRRATRYVSSPPRAIAAYDNNIPSVPGEDVERDAE